MWEVSNSRPPIRIAFGRSRILRPPKCNACGRSRILRPPTRNGSIFLLFFYFFRRKGERRNGAIPSPGGGSPTPGAVHHLGDSPAPARRSMQSGVTLSGSSVEARETGCTGGRAAVGQKRHAFNSPASKQTGLAVQAAEQL